MKDKNVKRKMLQDRNFPNSDQINKHQNFDRINKDYTMIKNIMTKKILAWTGALIVGVASVVTAVILNKSDASDAKEKVEQEAQVQTAAPYIQAPLPGMETPFNGYKISLKDGGTFQYPTGSIITIPANAFLSKEGAISDSIEIKYREFHNPLEIFLSGIPMKYDSGGTQYILESAGMIEIRAFDGEKSLMLNEKTPVLVKMASANTEERFNLYELDTVSRNWMYKGKDHIEVLQQEQTVKEKKSMNAPVASNENMIKPVMSDPEKYCFNIGYDEKDFPELSAYENVIFQVTDNTFKPAYYKINWKKISLFNGDKAGSYVVQLKKADTSISVNAVPVFDKENYSKALEVFQGKHNKVSSERDQNEFEKRSKLNKVNKELSGYNSRKLTTATIEVARGNNFIVQGYRVFSINGMGYHNCDFPLLQRVLAPPQPRLAAVRSTENSKAVAYNTIFLVEKGKNTVFRFSKNERLKYNPASKNLMWTITDNSEIAFFRIADYSKISSGAEVAPVVASNQNAAFEEISKFSE